MGRCGSVFFFFKQKTAYEMRISDWSSDVCSSDLDEETLSLPRLTRQGGKTTGGGSMIGRVWNSGAEATPARAALSPFPDACGKIGRASCRERVCQYV